MATGSPAAAIWAISSGLGVSALAVVSASRNMVLQKGIFTEGDTWDELRANVLEATALHFEVAPGRPRIVRLHYIEDEMIRVEAEYSGL